MKLPYPTSNIMSHKRASTTGMIWASFSTILVKLMSFISQIFLGWLLSKDDFGLYAISISISSFIVPLQNGGIHKLLIQRCKDYDSIAPDLYKFALVFNIAIMFLLVAAAPASANLFEAKILLYLLVIIALSIPLRTPSAILRAKLLNDFRFKENAAVETASSFLRNCSTIIFALTGFGPLSFVLPLLVVALFENLAFAYLVRQWPKGGVLSWDIAKELFLDAKWIMLGGLLLTLSLQGDYLVIGLIKNPTILGTYFFAFQLSISFSVLFTSGINSVMMPSFSKLSDQPKRQKDAFLKAFRLLSFVVAPFVVAMALLMEPCIDFLWAGKWNATIITTQLLLLSLLTRLPMVLSQSYLESKGYWKLRSLIQFIDTIGLLFFAAIGAWSGGVLSIAISISSYRLITGFIFCIFGCYFAGIRKKLIIKYNGIVSINSLLAGVLGIYISKIAVPNQSQLIESLIALTMFLTAFMIYSWFFKQQDLKEVLSLIRNL